MFDRTVLVTIDGSELSIEAGRQAAALAGPDARILAVTVTAGSRTADMPTDIPRQPPPDAAEEGLRLAASVLRAARREGAGAVETQILSGFAPKVLVAAVGRESADLVSVGMRHLRRAEGFFTGGLATELLHSAPCPVLAGRSTGRPETGIVVVGIDGSPQSAQALAAARHICLHRGGHLRIVAATGSKSIDLAAARAMAGSDELTVEAAGAIDALVAASSDADLLVVGSRGLHGLRALGSVSERIAHSSTCSALVYR